METDFNWWQKGRDGANKLGSFGEISWTVVQVADGVGKHHTLSSSYFMLLFVTKRHIGFVILSLDTVRHPIYYLDVFLFLFEFNSNL